jgi:hypothetical protein
VSTSELNPVAHAARECIASGFGAPIPLPPRSKNPDRKGWQNERWTLADVETRFPADENIGLLLGEASNNRADVDLDCQQAILAAPFFLPATPFIHGRTSALRSHWWYTATPLPGSLEFRDVDGQTVDGKTKFLELRTGSGQQTVIPPSIHADTGEQLTWEPSAQVDGAVPTEIDGAQLTAIVRELGAAAFLARHWPLRGSRHDYALALAGFLLRQHGWDVPRTETFVRAAATAAADDEIADRVNAVRTTVEQLAAKQDATGGKKFRELAGNAVFDRFCEWLGIVKPLTGNVLPLIESAVIPNARIEDWPATALEGDYIADLTDLLTDGTPIPKQFVREQIILALAALCDQVLGYPLHHGLTIRRYLALVSERPQSGKGESWKRVGGKDGVLRFYLDTGTVKVLNASGIGSGQYLAKILEETPRVIAVWDEASQLFQQTGQQNSTLLTALKTLFESTSHWSGSFTNKKCGTDDAHLSIALQSTRKTFVQGFSLRGGVGDGLLSRFVISHASAWPVVPIWAQRDYARETALVGKIIGLVPTIHAAPAIEDQAQARMNEFTQEMNGSERPHPDHTPRLLEHAKVDLLMRTIFSGSQTITLDQVERSIAWARHQLKLRLEFWPPDADDRVPAMIQTLQRRLRKGSASERDLRAAANVDRDGTHELFARAKAALLRSGSLTVIGRNRKGRDVYGLEPEETEIS